MTPASPSGFANSSSSRTPSSSTPSSSSKGRLLLLVLAAAAVCVGPWVTWRVFLLLWPLRWPILASIAAVEACFYSFYYLPAYAKHSRIPQPCMPQGYTDAEGVRLFRRFIQMARDLPGGIDVREYLQQWFCDAPFEAIGRENVAEMLTYGFFYKTRDQLSPELRGFPQQMVRDLEGACRVKFTPGYTPGLRFMSHLWEPLRAEYRPLLMYLGMEALYLLQRLIMAKYGFRHRSYGHVGYYTLGCGLDEEAYTKRLADSSSSSSSTAAAAKNSNASTAVSKSSSNSNAVLLSSSSSRLDRAFEALLSRLRPPAPPVDRLDSATSTASEPSAGAAAAGGGGGAGGGEDDYTPFADPLASASLDDLAPPHGGPHESLHDDISRMTNPLEAAVPQQQQGQEAVPVMFLHGVGGLMLYLELLKHVIGLGHPIIVIEYKHVGMRISSSCPCVESLTRAVVGVLELESIPKVCVVGHSYGSFIASKLNMSYRERVHSLCVIDPVALGMFMPHLLHTFMYRRPRVDVRRPDILLRDLVLWFASRDIHLAATFARNFYWTAMNLWPQDLPPGSVIILSGDDDLCNAEGVESMCKMSPHVKVVVNHALFHGAFLFSAAHKAGLMVEVRALLASRASAMVTLVTHNPLLAHTLSAAHSLLVGVETLKSRLSMSPQPFGSSATRQPFVSRQQQQQQQPGAPRGQGGGLWSTMSSLAPSLARRRSSVPAPAGTAAAAGSTRSRSLTPQPTRTTSAPLSDATAAAAAAAAGQPLRQPPAASTAAALLPAAGGSLDLAAAAGGGDGSSRGASPQQVLANPAGWWGPAAAAAAADCGQQPGATAAAAGVPSGAGQHPKQLSVILSGQEGTLTSDLAHERVSGQATSTGTMVVLSGPEGTLMSDLAGMEDDWVMTDQDLSGCGSSGQLLPNTNTGIGSPEDGQQQQQQPQGPGGLRQLSQSGWQAAAAAAAAGGSSGGAAAAAAAPKAGPAAVALSKAASPAAAGDSDAAAAEDQAPAGPDS